LFSSVVKTKWPNETKDTKDKVIDRLKKTNVNKWMTKESKEAKNKEKTYKKNRNPEDNQYSFVFSISFVDVVIFNKI